MGKRANRMRYIWLQPLCQYCSLVLQAPIVVAGFVLWSAVLWSSFLLFILSSLSAVDYGFQSFKSIPELDRWDILSSEVVGNLGFGASWKSKRNAAIREAGIP